ncbi:MAG: TetR/AcrR family transcriptional regulator [Microthrixaceae bacterium]
MSSSPLVATPSAAPRGVPEAPAETTRRHLSDRQAATVQRLVDAALEELRDGGYDGLTVRNVARRAEVAPATAYTYFGSREHLVTEMFWRRLAAMDDTPFAAGASPSERAAATLRDLALLVADEPQLAAACTVAMMAPAPDVALLRDRIGAEMHRRLVVAVGEDQDPAIVRALDLTVSGALVHAGTGHLAYRDLPARLAEVAELVMGER